MANFHRDIVRLIRPLGLIQPELARSPAEEMHRLGPGEVELEVEFTGGVPRNNVNATVFIVAPRRQSSACTS